ncbi:hypothetical protein [Ulvibacter antarcticus]|uniref:Uncharacterized protein n=1 Tax=Ulvibacter antarcticus TaxID=442714 RepID=A0A3L9YWR7_9FLAO|nr:hypothetical protein [Ulvibacter antarcticus]RMA64230.1 hypothetical protein BXY75_1103 [Ulvibacter antarcticus]
MSILLKQVLEPAVISKGPSERKPIVVFNARVESQLKKTKLKKKNSSTLFTAEWMLFMDEMNKDMFNKISS